MLERERGRENVGHRFVFVSFFFFFSLQLLVYGLSTRATAKMDPLVSNFPVCCAPSLVSIWFCIILVKRDLFFDLAALMRTMDECIGDYLFA